MKSKSSTEKVREYYDSNTRRFLRFGHGRGAHAIHRAVWGPGVATRDEAMHYVNQLILAELRTAGSSRVLDLGRGVGGTIAYLADRHRSHYSGITLSEVQATIGRRIFEARTDVALRAGDFHRREDLGAGYDAVYAIESLIHAENPRTVVQNIRAATRRPTLLIVCDDFLAETAPERDAPAWRTVRRFMDGWHASGLSRLSGFVDLCASLGLRLVSDRDLTPHLELGRPRDRLIRAAMAAFAWLPLSTPWWANMLGGDALQTCLRNGWIGYHFLVFRG